MQVPSAELALIPRLPCGPGSCDLEFHRFPVLFTPGSWPRFDRDVALFNFWANETLPKTKNRPNIGSGVAFFNRTKPARDLLTAWSEAMANPHNERAPDDQVLSPLRPGPRVSCPPSERPGAPQLSMLPRHQLTGVGSSPHPRRVAQARLVWMASDVVPSHDALLLPRHRACNRSRPRVRARAGQAFRGQASVSQGAHEACHVDKVTMPKHHRP